MNSNTIWALVAGLAVGLLVGRELPHHGSGESSGSSAATAEAPSKAPSGAAAVAPKEIPADLLKLETEMKATDKMAGMTVAQRYQVLKVMNDKPCDCGCPHGSSGKCLAEDPNCPRAPKILEQAIALAKQGKSADEITAAVKKPEGGGNNNAPPAGAPQKAEVAKWSPIKGPKQAKVTIVEYSDFQCPFCSRVGPTMKQIEEKYPKDVRIVWRNQPLPFHNNAVPAAEAAMAAGAQGKFFEMHDKLFANQGTLDREHFETWAKEIGLDLGKFKADLDGHKHKENIEADSKAGTALGASGTPSFFINGRPLVGAQPFDAFKTVIEEEIKHADELIKKGTSMDKLYEKILETLPAAAPAAAAPSAPPPTEHVDIDPGNAPSKGPKNAPITIVIFSDFQCPFCSRVEPTLAQVEKEYAGKVRFAWKNQPLPFHDKAHLAAEASLAAHAQGKFWEMHDAMFKNQQEIDRAGLEKRATELGLNMDKFKKALDTGLYKDQVDKESAEGTKVGASGTPTFFINGDKLVGAQPFDNFKKAIDAALAKKKG